eukprot:gene34680-41996_t
MLAGRLWRKLKPNWNAVDSMSYNFVYNPQQQSQSKFTKALARTIIASSKKQAVSTASERARHQDQFKKEAIGHYQAQSETSSDYIRCSVLGRYIRRDHVVAAHLCGLDEQQKLPVLGKDISFKWSWKNCVLMYKPIEKLFDSMEVTLLYHPDTHQVTFQVLFDYLLEKAIGYDFDLFEGYSVWSAKRKKQFRKSMFQTYADLNGQPLHFPVLKLPSKTILNWAAKSAYDAALNSEVPHECAADSMPSEDAWALMTGDNTPSASRLESLVEGEDLESNSEEGGDNEEDLAIEDLV